MSRSRDIAKFAGSASVFSYPTTDGSDGQTLTTDGAGNLLLEAASGAGVSSYTNTSDLPLSGNTAGDLAYVNETGRLYVNNGTGWYNVSLVNTNPSITSVQDASNGTSPFVLTTDGTATVITITASDPEEVPLTYSYSVTSGSLTNGGGTTATVSQGTGANTNVFTITPTTNLDYSGSFTLTFTASDGINQATSAASFSLAFTISNSKYSAFLLKTDNTATDNQVDASSNSLTITETGNVTSTAFTPYHPKGYSTYFDGSDDSLQITTSGDLQAIGRSGSECTIEAWVYLMSTPASDGVGIYSQGTQSSVSGTNIISFEIEADRTVRAIVNGGYSSTTGCPLSTGTVEFNEWTHLALVLYNQTWTIYINGTADGTATGSYPSGTNHNTAYIGRNFYGSNRTAEMYIRDLRVTSTAEYTSNFTPTTESLTVVTGTELLTCQDPYIVDNSTNSFDITTNGDPATKTFTPYDHGAYSRSSHGGSVYFDGSSDRLEIADGSAVEFGTGDFTVECWVYKTDSFKNYDTVWSKYTNVDDIGYWLHTNSSGAILFGYDGFNFGTSTETLSLNTWHHIAAVRDSGTMKVYLDGTATSISISYSGDTANTEDFWIGGMANVSRWFQGYISDFRIVKGTAVYTSNFTPPTAPLTAITNTQLLTCSNKNSAWDAAGGSPNLLQDNATFSTSITKYENESVQLDGTGDYIKIDENNPVFDVSTGDFTWEGWFRFDSLSNNPKIFINLASASVYWQLYVYSNALRLLGNGGNTLSGADSSSLSTATWYHIALVRSGSTFTVYKDGTSVITDTNSASIGHNSDYGVGGIAYSSSTCLDGNVEGVRLSKYARYTSNFTPPTAALEG